MICHKKDFVGVEKKERILEVAMESHVMLIFFYVGFGSVVACADAVFHKNLALPCVFSIDFEG